MAFSKKRKDEQELIFQQLYQAGFVLHRGEDFYQRVELFMLGYVPIGELEAAIKKNIPLAFPTNVFVPVSNTHAFVFSNRWKAVIEMLPVNSEVCSYRLRFAEPPENPRSDKHMDIYTEMNIAATAIEKALLGFNKATQVIMTYAPAKERQFEIGPNALSSDLPDLRKLAKLKNMSDMTALAMDWATNFVIEASSEMISDYLAERKSNSKLGSDAVSGLLGSRFLNTPACPEEVQAHFDAALARRRAARYCRKCGRRIPEGGIFCSYCGTRISNSAASEILTGYNASVSG